MSSLNPSSSTVSPFPKFTQFGATSIAHHQQQAAETVGIQSNQTSVYPFSCLPVGAAALSNNSIQSISSQFPVNTNNSFPYQQQFPAQLAVSVALNPWQQTLLTAGFVILFVIFSFSGLLNSQFQVKIGLLVEHLRNSIPRSQMGMWFYHGYRNL